MLNELSKEEWAKHNTTVWNCTSYNGYFASFDSEIPRRLIKYFTCAGDTILDPFMGSGTTLTAAIELNRNAYGIDCNKKAVEFAKRKLSETQKDTGALNNIFLEDSRNMYFFENEIFDFIVTSPPYYDIVHYSNEKEQLGNIRNYDDFIEEVTKVFMECYRVLKKDKYMCIVTADIRKSQRYYPIHVDYIKKLQESGFRLHQIMINVFKSSGVGKREKCMGYPSNFHPGMVHEYILIFQKTS